MNTPAPADLSDLYEIARFVGIPGEDMGRLIGLLATIGYVRLAAGSVVIDRKDLNQIMNAADAIVLIYPGMEPLKETLMKLRAKAGEAAYER